ncbi:MAG: DUF4474 domain-containing protein [Oscillospiraceae bacterium]|jgi:hypothetical protein|nr:DUF4474 domain-containing protein [Oscillospiraceae bacterium]
MFFKLFAKAILALLLAVIPMGQLPNPAPSYRSIANPTAAVMAPRESNRWGRQFQKDTYNAVGVFVHTVIDKINGKAVDKTVLRAAMDAMPIKERENVDNRKGTGTMPDNAGGLLPMFLKGNRDLFIYLIPTDKKDIYEIAGDYAMYNGTQMRAISGIFYNAVTGQISTINEKGIWGTSFNWQMDDFLVSMENNTFQRKLGFCALYDAMAPVLGMNIKNVRFKFPYDGKDWMIEAWKGNYSNMANGGEIGIYEKPKSRKIEFYDCSSTELPMSMALYHKGTKFITQEPRRTWWAGAFQPGTMIALNEMTLESSITFDDAGMQAAFKAAVDKAGVTCFEKGNTVLFVW